MNILRNKVVRWILLMIGLGAIIALTGMNVFSLYNLRDQMIEGEEERRINQVDEIHTLIRNALYDPIFGFSKIELETVEATIEETGQFPAKLQEVLLKVSQNEFYKGIYYTPEGIDPCEEDAEIYAYDYDSDQIIPTDSYPEGVCDGVGIARTKTKVQLNDLNYRWNYNIEFDTHRSLNLGLINLTESKLVGYLTFIMDDEAIVNELISPLINDYFEASEESGVVVWLYNWISNEVLATNDPTVQYDRNLVDHTHRFPNFLNNWNIRLAILQSPIASVYNATLAKNLIVLGVAVLFLGGALIFMFVTAQRERNLAQLQANFLANVTHELKTPLAVMQAAGENISDGRVIEKDRLKKYGQHIYDESIRLRRMIEKLLDVARVDSGQTMIKAVPYKLHDLVKKYIDENRDYLENKNFTVKFDSKDKQAVCMADEDSLETILNNLTDNAVKYSGSHKEIHYSVYSDENYVYLSVRDQGIGIPKKALKNVFNKFFRVEDSLKAKTKGHGLGLSIVKNLVVLNGGEISVESDLGKGTTFVVRFPKLISENYSEEQVQIGQTGKKINKSTEYVG
ncbi:MAG: HAMP domain-containing sensor histidine kinase [Balneolaceae bacterium]